MVRIQMKVYDATGKRVAVEEAVLADYITPEDAASYVAIECKKLKNYCGVLNEKVEADRSLKQAAKLIEEARDIIVAFEDGASP